MNTKQATLSWLDILTKLSDNEVVGLTPIVSQPTRGYSILDRVYVSGSQHSGVKVVKSAMKSDHQAVVAFTDIIY